MHRIEPDRLRREGERSKHIFTGEFAVPGEEVVDTSTAGRCVQDVLNGQASPANTWLAEHYLGVTDDSLVIHFASTPSSGTAVPRTPDPARCRAPPRCASAPLPIL